MNALKHKIREVCAIHSKAYSVLIEDEELKKKIKGVKKSCFENEITFDDYKKFLFNNITKNVDMNLIRSHQHEIFNESVNKPAFCGINDKRYMLNNIQSLAYGHYKISKNWEK